MKEQLIGQCRLLGRVVGVRQVGKVRFLDVMRDHRITQLITKCSTVVGRGDIIEAIGEICPTRDGLPGVKGEISRILSRFSGTHFPDRKMGQLTWDRCVDLLANLDSNRTFRERATIINTLRSYLYERGFLEVETPVLSASANGAVARPFATKSISGEDLYLRIAPELYLKRLVIGGFDRVFEVGRVFRNEGIDATHNPEFTGLELYQAFAEFGHLKVMTREIFGMFKGLEIKQEIDIIDVLEARGAKLDLNSDVDSQLIHYAKKFGIYEEKKSSLKLFDKLVKHFVEPLCKLPTIVSGFPLFTSPLAASNPKIPTLADRLEVYVACTEVANGYQELTDPEEQELRFRGQQKIDESDPEVPLPDADYIDALRLGLPPTIGLGIGIDRLVMLATGAPSLRHVIFFSRP